MRGTGAAETVGHVALERELSAPSAASRGPLVHTHVASCTRGWFLDVRTGVGFGFSKGRHIKSRVLWLLSAALSVCCDRECGQVRMRTEPSITPRRTSSPRGCSGHVQVLYVSGGRGVSLVAMLVLAVESWRRSSTAPIDVANDGADALRL